MRTLHHLCEKEPKSIVSQRAENAIFWCLDMETFGETIVHARGAVHALLLFDAPRHPISWMKCVLSLGILEQLEGLQNKSQESGLAFNRKIPL